MQCEDQDAHVFIIGEGSDDNEKQKLLLNTANSLHTVSQHNACEISCRIGRLHFHRYHRNNMLKGAMSTIHGPTPIGKIKTKSDMLLKRIAHYGTQVLFYRLTLCYCRAIASWQKSTIKFMYKYYGSRAHRFIHIRSVYAKGVVLQTQKGRRKTAESLCKPWTNFPKLTA